MKIEIKNIDHNARLYLTILLGAVLYAIFGHFVVLGSGEPYQGVISYLWCSSFLTSFSLLHFTKLGKDKAAFFFSAGCLIVAVHSFYLLVINQMEPHYVLASIIVFIATTENFSLLPKPLIVLQGMSVLALVLLTSLIETQFPKIVFIGCTALYLIWKGFNDFYSLKINEKFYEEKLLIASLFNSVNDALVIFEKNSGKIIECNQAFCDLYKIKKSKVEQYSFYSFATDQPESFERREYHNHIWHKSADGKIMPVELHYFPISFDPKLQIASIRNVSSRVNIENEQRDMEKALQIQSRLASLGEMASGIAHEINNPLAILNMNMMITKKLIKNENLEKREIFEKNIQDCEDTILRISKIVTSMRRLARDSSRDDIASISLATIETNALDLCHEKFKSYGVNIEFDGFLPHKEILCREIEIGQVLINLMNNAFDAVSSVENKWIKVFYEEDQDHHYIKVQDSGPGIPKNVKDKIFQPFFTTKEIGKGTGIGLSISKTIIEKYNGKLYLDETEKYTTIAFKIPKDESAQQKAS